MPKHAPLTTSEVEYLCRRKQLGATHRAVAQELNCSLETVKKYWRRQRQGKPRPTRGRPKQGVLSTYAASLRTQAVQLKRTHPHWGPQMVQLELKTTYHIAAHQLPSRSRLSALFKAECPEAVQVRHHSALPAEKPTRSGAAHQRWQMDGKENVRSAQGETWLVLDIRDPCAALQIHSRVFVVSGAERVSQRLTSAEVQTALREAFTHWGLPLEIQTDHEGVYVGAAQSDFPSPFTLWLCGLGITHRLIRKQHPTDQAQVERSHRTFGDWTWKNETYETAQQLQQTLDTLRQHYHDEVMTHAKGCAGQPPLVHNPSAKHSGRSYDLQVESELFNLQRVDAFLQTKRWKRKVSINGTITLGDQIYYVGRTHRRLVLTIRFVPEHRLFHFETEEGTRIAELPARGLEAEDLMGFVTLPLAETLQFQLPLPLVGV